jgi:hypothetical protein
VVLLLALAGQLLEAALDLRRTAVLDGQVLVDHRDGLDGAQLVLDVADALVDRVAVDRERDALRLHRELGLEALLELLLRGDVEGQRVARQGEAADDQGQGRDEEQARVLHV